MGEVTVSAKYQIRLPHAARQALGVKPRDKMLVVVRGRTVILLRKPTSYCQAIRGLVSHRYPEGYLSEERSSWR